MTRPPYLSQSSNTTDYYSLHISSYFSLLIISLKITTCTIAKRNRHEQYEQKKQYKRVITTFITTLLLAVKR